MPCAGKVSRSFWAPWCFSLGRGSLLLLDLNSLLFHISVSRVTVMRDFAYPLPLSRTPQCFTKGADHVSARFHDYSHIANR